MCVCQKYEDRISEDEQNEEATCFPAEDAGEHTPKSNWLRDNVLRNRDALVGIAIGLDLALIFLVIIIAIV
jgi:hypothetical protein